MRHRTAGAALGGLLLTLVTACGGSAPSATSLADKQRRPVAKEYWKIYRAVHDVTNGWDVTDGTFEYCAGKRPRLDYRIVYFAAGLSGKESEAQIDATLVARLKTVGWDLAPAGSKRFSATRGDLTVRTYELPESPETGKRVVTVNVQSGCVDYGKNVARVLKVVDEYPNADAACSPVPTGLATRTP
ncbi:hypothetical protein OG896_26605 [Streptomyces sp. NBC_00669]|uniref:hypothetical protein n=1 Tax=Streptomyces sp. NBC_00669 TaxID=2976011 RepID=UPI002E32D6EA|nr:hypothetical protein [Streptomyces sp. NBC_00669]